MDRQEHLDWCKQRALEYVDSGDVVQGYTSFMSDMGKHEETRDHIALDLLTQMFLGQQITSPEKMRKFINDFN